MLTAKKTLKPTIKPANQRLPRAHADRPGEHETDPSVRVKTTLYLPETTHQRVRDLACTRQITTNAALTLLIERGLEYPDDETISSIRSHIERTEDKLLTSINDRRDSQNTELSELKEITEEVLWVTVYILTGRLKAGDFGTTPEVRRSRQAEIESLVEEYIQHRQPNCLSRIKRRRSRH